MKKSYYLLIFYTFLYLFVFIFIGLPFTINSFFGDYWVYYESYLKFWNPAQTYWESINYLPSLYFLSIFFIDGFVFAVFLVVSSILSIYLLLKIEDTYFAVLIFSLMLLTVILSGNIEPFVFLITLICCIYKYNRYIPPLLLAFVCFKLNVIFIVPFFLYWSKNRRIFILLFGSSFILYNFYFVINYTEIIDFLQYGVSTLNPSNIFLRLTLVYVIYQFVRIWEKETENDEKQRKIERFMEGE